MMSGSELRFARTRRLSDLLTRVLLKRRRNATIPSDWSQGNCGRAGNILLSLRFGQGMPGDRARWQFRDPAIGVAAARRTFGGEVLDVGVHFGLDDFIPVMLGVENRPLLLRGTNAHEVRDAGFSLLLLLPPALSVGLRHRTKRSWASCLKQTRKDEGAQNC